MQYNTKPPKAAMNFFTNYLIKWYGDKVALNEALANKEMDLNESVETVLTQVGVPSNFASITETFHAQWKKLTGISTPLSSDASESEGEEEQIEQLINNSGLTVPSEMIPIITQQYQTILTLLNGGLICIRWKYLDANQRRIVEIRLQEGLCVVIGHLYTSHNIKTSEALKVYLGSTTIILHGSYLFGANNYTPNDMDIIIPGCTCKKSNYAGKISRPVVDQKMNLGQSYSLIDVMVGIPLCIQPADLIRNYTGKSLWKEVGPLLKGYLNKIGGDEPGKDYRKLVNCAIVLQYIRELNGQAPDAKLQGYITQANNAITTVSPNANKDIIKAFLTACNQYIKDLT